MLRGMNAIRLTREKIRKFVEELENLLAESPGIKVRSNERIETSNGVEEPEIKEWCCLQLTGSVRVRYNTSPILDGVMPGADYRFEVSFFDQTSALEWAIKIVEICHRLNIDNLGVEGYSCKRLHEDLSVVSGCWLRGPHLNDLSPTNLLPVLKAVEEKSSPITRGIQLQINSLAAGLSELFPKNQHQQFARSAASCMVAGLRSTTEK